MRLYSLWHSYKARLLLVVSIFFISVTVNAGNEKKNNACELLLAIAPYSGTEFSYRIKDAGVSPTVVLSSVDGDPRPLSTAENNLAKVIVQNSANFNFLHPSWLPLKISIAREGTLETTYAYEYEALVGQHVIGIHQEPEYHGMGKITFKVKTFSGKVVEAEFVEEPLNSDMPDRLILKLEREDGATDTVNLAARGRRELSPHERMYIVKPRTPVIERLRQAFFQSQLDQLVEEAFGSPTQLRDYEIAETVVDTFVKTPATFGSSAVIKILLGRQVKGGENYAHFGVAKSDRRYSEKALKKFMAIVEKFMVEKGVIGQDRSDDFRLGDESQNMPEFIRHHDRTELGPSFVSLWTELREKKQSTP